MPPAAAASWVGLMSGTSVDGIDAALVRFTPEPQLLAARTMPWPEALRRRLLALMRPDAQVRLVELGTLDHDLGEAFAAATLELLRAAGTDPAEVRAIGSHGQTVCHHPGGAAPFTLQIGDAAVIAERTGIDVVADFRRADMAAGGEGAPLLPVLHAQLLADPAATRVVLNLGGIANVTVLAPGEPVRGFDTGPANALLDAWAARHLATAFDRDGAWAAAGHVDAALLERCLADPFFARPPPKSTGREHFNLAWLEPRLRPGLAAADVQATLLALTAASIAAAVRRHAPGAAQVIACGGGVHNAALMRALGAALAPAALVSSAAHGVDPDFLEATAFAWLARQHVLGRAGNLPAVTGARGPRVLGMLAPAPRAAP